MRFLLLLSFILFSSCSKDNNENSICPNGNCWVRLYTDFQVDSNGYYKVSPEWYSETSGRFNLHIESSPTVGRCQYNGVTVVSSRFDSDSYWEIESGLSFTFGLYNPFESFYTQQGDIIKVRDTTVTLDYFQGQIQPIVQETSIYHYVKTKWNVLDGLILILDLHQGRQETRTLYTKRIVGPLIREMIGDTLKIYSETFFDCGMNSELVRDSISVILK